MPGRIWIAAALIVICGSGDAGAWSQAGHKIAASIAYRLASEQRRKEVADILRRHPRYEADFAAKFPKDLPPEHVDEWLWQQASYWPDICRGFPDDLKAIYHHGTWHYCNRPLFLTAADKTAMEPLLTVNVKTGVPADLEGRLGMNILQAIEFNEALALDQQTPPAERAIAICWLFHLAGDIHQPLHSVSMFSEKLFPSPLEGDRGGNLVLTKQRERLHGLWDSFPGGDIQFKTAMQRALTWMNDDEYRIPAHEAARELSSQAWFDESHELARDYGYNEEVTTFLKQIDPALAPEDRPKLELSEDYLKTAGLISRQRIVTAGFRLGKLLQ